jgi:hypothetical protein
VSRGNQLELGSSFIHVNRESGVASPRSVGRHVAAGASPKLSPRFPASLRPAESEPEPRVDGASDCQPGDPAPPGDRKVEVDGQVESLDEVDKPHVRKVLSV